MKAFIFLINFYQGAISPALGRSCRFYPSCSEYLKQAVVSAGLLRGLAAGAQRLLRCHPFSEGGFDPCPARTEGNTK